MSNEINTTLVDTSKIYENGTYVLSNLNPIFTCKSSFRDINY